jgi:putative ABC transport system permease protein
MVVRLASSAGPILDDLLRMAASQPGIDLRTAASADALLSETIRSQRFQSWLFGAFGVAALAIVCVGVLGIVALGAARRTREVGIRIALGARPASVVRLLIGEQMPAVVVGLIAGSVVSSWVVRSLDSYLYEVTPYDLRIWAAAIGAITAVAFLGILVPARRASRVDPAVVLRND